MFRKAEPTVMEQLQKEYDLDDFSYSLVSEYLKLTESQRKAVRDFFYNVLKNKEV